MELVLQLPEFRANVLPLRDSIRVAHVCTAVGTDVHEPLLLEESERGTDRVACHAMNFLKLPVGRQFAAGSVPALLDLRSEDARQASAINAPVVWSLHAAIVPGVAYAKAIDKPTVALLLS